MTITADFGNVPNKKDFSDAVKAAPAQTEPVVAKAPTNKKVAGMGRKAPTQGVSGHDFA